jgi:hypothetical protein
VNQTINVLDLNITYHWVEMSFVEATKKRQNWFRPDSSSVNSDDKWYTKLLKNLHFLTRMTPLELINYVSDGECTQFGDKKAEDCLHSIKEALSTNVFPKEKFLNFCHYHYLYLLTDDILTNLTIDYIRDGKSSPFISNWKKKRGDYCFSSLQQLRDAYVIMDKPTVSDF